MPLPFLTVDRGRAAAATAAEPRPHEDEHRVPSYRPGPRRVGGAALLLLLAAYLLFSALIVVLAGSLVIAGVCVAVAAVVITVAVRLVRAGIRLSPLEQEADLPA
ncbi:hypothetical protein [Streptomyces blastmyceticus]|uniref:Integral membrane protein n=1 Tax=Streptomyces blastmyceticus TaxID=68180 RepID=A0ABN0XUI2_9ACTN